MDRIVLSLKDANLTRSALDKCDFNCARNPNSPKPGEISLNYFLRKQALKAEQEGTTKTFVVLSEGSTGRVLGYYSSSAGVVVASEVQDSSMQKRPFPLPAFLLGRWAVDASAQSCGIGKLLLKHAFNSAIEISEKMGIYAVRVDPIDEEVRQDYMKNGWLSLQNNSSLYLPIAVIKEAMAQGAAQKAANISQASAAASQAI